MTYQYGGKDTIEAAQARQAELQAELQAARETYKAAQKLARENERIQAQILRTQQRAQALATPLPKQPEPIHGGPLGLKRATNEIAQWHRQRRQRTAA